MAIMVIKLAHPVSTDVQIVETVLSTCPPFHNGAYKHFLLPPPVQVVGWCSLKGESNYMSVSQLGPGLTPLTQTPLPPLGL